MNRFRHLKQSPVTRTGARRRTAADCSAAGPAHRRGGAALIVVISLLGTLAFLGFLFYSFAAQELASSENFAAASTPTAPLPPDVFWDWSLEQIIIGTNAGLTNSALYGNKFSLLANMLGTPNADPPGFKTFGAMAGPGDLTWGRWGPDRADVQPFDGAGLGTVVTDLNTAADGPLTFGFDINQDGQFSAAGPTEDVLFDGSTAASWENFVMNFSPAADSPVAAFPVYASGGRSFSGILQYGTYEPDAGYTYPDINSPFLAYDALVRGWGDGGTGPNDARNFRVMIPSYFRPQLFPRRRGTSNDSMPPYPSGSNDNGFGDIYLAPETTRQVLRPHLMHVASVPPATPSVQMRYVSPVDPAFSEDLDMDGFPDGDVDGDGTSDGIKAKSGDTNRIIRTFPFQVDLDGDGNFNEMGVWTNPGQGDTAAPGKVHYELDVDTDGDGIRDAIWMDLDFPLMTLPDGRQFVPMFGVKIVDLDSLLNVNAHGNAHGLYVRLSDGSIEVIGPDSTAIVGPGGLAETISFHQSNLGASRSEVNLSLALTADLRDGTQVDPETAKPPNQLNNQDVIDSQFELASNYEYMPGSVYSSPSAPPVGAISNLEALMLLKGRRDFERLRNGNIREKRRQIRGREGDTFKIRDLYRTLATAGLVDGNEIPGPLPGGWALDDDGDSNILGLAPFFGGDGDDDIDAPGLKTSNLRREGGAYFADADLFGVQVPPFVHPLDYLGTGRDYLDLTGGATPLLSRFIASGITTATNPTRWPRYFDASGGTQLGLWQYQRIPADDTLPNTTGVVPWHQALGGGVLQSNNSFYDFLLDEPNETILEPDFRNPEYDAVYPTFEMEGIHLSDGDFQKIKGISRLRQLASINLEKVRESVAATIRKKLTTDSWDRLEPSQTRFQTAASTAFDRTWEYTAWTGANEDFLTDPSDPTVVAFPPEFGASTALVPAGSATDPFRPEVRLLLKNERFYTGNMTGDTPAGGMGRYPRRKLNLNKILSGETTVAPATANDIDRRAFDDDGNPRFRNLTPHPVFEPTDPMIAMMPPVLHDNVTPGTEHTAIGDAQVDFRNLDMTVAGTADVQKKAQEWWARYDRQRLARDIYVLLYTFGCGRDGVNVLNNTLNDGSAAEPYPVSSTTDLDSNGINDTLEAMAQFAVNYVDALDRDNVITRFEYDTNLSDGWSWTTGGPVANGVEAQQLAFSEALWVRTLDVDMGDSSTSWDGNDVRNFLYIELRNPTPLDVDFADETWRIARVDASADPPTVLAAFEWQEPPPPPPPAVAFDDKVSGGRTYLIACHDNTMVNGGDVPSSDMYHESNPAATGLDAVVPYRNDGTDTMAGGANPPYPSGAEALPTADLDLSYMVSTGMDDQNRFTLNPAFPGTIPGTLVSDADNTFAGPIVLSLQRRRHLTTRGVIDFANDAQAQEDANEGTEWIEVDRFEVELKEYGDPAMPPMTPLQSQERIETLERKIVANSSGMAPNMGRIQHTLGDPSFDLSMRTVTDNNIDTVDRNQGNSVLTGDMQIWQPHFDRDLSSIFELFAVPLFEPQDVTSALTSTDGSTPGKLSGLYFDTTLATPDFRPAVAGRLFTTTDPGIYTTDTMDDSDPGAGTGLDDDVRWYRLLEFVEIPDRAEEAIRERLVDIVRTPGRMNLNTIRHEEVLAALIDDPSILKFDSPLGRMTDGNPAFDSNVDDPTVGPPPHEFANWMDELRFARDGIDPINYLAVEQFGGVQADRVYIPLPGIPGAPANPSDTAAPYSSGSGRPQFGASPFRSLSYVDSQQTDPLDAASHLDAVSRTLMRPHVPPIGQGGTAQVVNRVDALEDLGLFEARPTTDVGVDNYDFHTRHRLLAKVANNATNRSNVFAVWIAVEFFEAHQPIPDVNPNVVQVGAKLEGSPTHRGFFIIDRTRLEEAVDKDSITNPADNNGRNDAFRFDWREFVIHRRTIQ